MFGIVLANLESLNEAERERYHEVYCGICHSLKSRYGQVSRMCVSYDMVLLAMLRESILENGETVSSARCLAHPTKEHQYAQGPQVDYAADASIALAYHKCLDDWNDDRRKAAKVYSSALSHAYKRVKDAHPAVCQEIEQELQAIRAMEAECKNAVAIGAFAETLQDRPAIGHRTAGKNAQGIAAELQDANTEAPVVSAVGIQNVDADAATVPDASAQDVNADSTISSAASMQDADKNAATTSAVGTQNVDASATTISAASAQNVDVDALMASADEIAKRFGAVLAMLFSEGCGYWSEDLAAFGAELGRTIYFMDAAIDRADDAKSGSYNPFNLCNTPDEEVELLMSNLLGRATNVFERLPLERDLNLMRSVLYAGIWQRLRAQHQAEGEEGSE